MVCQPSMDIETGVTAYDNCFVFTGRNEVGPRLYFYRHVSVHRKGLPQCMLGYAPPRSRHPPGADIPPSRHPPPGSTTPWEQTPPGSRPPEQTPPGKQTPAYGQRAAGTHPTGMHSCSKISFLPWLTVVSFLYHR